MLRSSILCIYICSLSCTCTFAADTTASNPCADVQTSQQVNECAAKRYELADHDLNDTYKQFMHKIDKDYKAMPKLGIKYRSAIKRAQQAWIKYRDTNCSALAFETETGSLAETSTLNDCLARMTSERTNELKNLLKW